MNKDRDKVPYHFAPRNPMGPVLVYVPADSKAANDYP